MKNHSQKTGNKTFFFVFWGNLIIIQVNRWFIKFIFMEKISAIKKENINKYKHLNQVESVKSV